MEYLRIVTPQVAFLVILGAFYALFFSRNTSNIIHILLRAYIELHEFDLSESKFEWPYWDDSLKLITLKVVPT